MTTYENRLIKIGKRIKEIRKFQKLTQIELAFKAGVDYNTLIKVEGCRTKNPGAIFCAKIANALNVSIDAIITIEQPHATMNGCSPYFFKEEDVQEYFSNKS